MSREAMLYEKREDGKTACRLCAHACVVASSKRGICGVRENREGILYALNYGRIVAENVDPIEKKPLFHFLPGSRSYSIASAGCNFRCRFCQNYEISQMPAETGRIPGMMTEPGEIVRRAIESGSRSISYTYTEPTIFFEFAYETAKRAREEGLRNVFVTNGYMTGEALDKV
ncbi:MAG TPA: radical SAM protein, partial [Syntrophales bacterium]|nr:radical SAM protein [Syntrophales bacterium]